jgi:hypothetical protein
LLEAFGDIKSANILHKKFIREAQSLDPKRDSGPYKQVFDRYFNAAKINPSPKLISSIRSDGFLLKEDQDQLVDYITEMINTKPLVQQAQPQAPATPAPTAVNTITTQAPAQNNSNPELAEPITMKSDVQQPQTSIADPTQNIFSKLLNEVKYYLSNNDFNNAAIIRDQAANSNMTPEQKNAWQQQYNTLVQNFSGTNNNSQYNVQQNAQSDIYNAFIQLGAKPNQVIPQYIARYEQQIRQKLQQMKKLYPATEQLLRQISLSAYYIPKQ